MNEKMLTDAAVIVPALMVLGATLKHAFPNFPNRFIPLMTLLLGVPAFAIKSGDFTASGWITAFLVSITATGAHSTIKNTLLGSAADTTVKLMLAGSVCWLATGCAYKVAPGADPVVVHAEQLAISGPKVLDAFLSWERSNEAALLKANPDIHAAADLCREYAPQAIRDLRAATKAYKQARTGGNLDKLKGSVAALDAILLSAKTYYLKGTK